MDKLAQQVRMADVVGCEAAFVKLGMVKVANDEAFNQLCEAVCEKLGEDDYDLNKVASVTAEVIDAANQQAPQEKQAAQASATNEAARNAALGELLLMKTAGQIDDATFKKEAENLMKMAMPGMGYVRKAGRGVLDALTGKGWRAQNAAIRDSRAGLAEVAKTPQFYTPNDKQNLANTLQNAIVQRRKEIAKTLGAGATAVGGAGLLGKSLYDKYAG